MTRTSGTVAGVLIASALGFAATAGFVTGLKAQSKAPVYAVIEVNEMIDADAFGKAVAGAPVASGKYLVRTQKVTSLDGDAPPSRFVVIAFESEEKLKEWRADPRIKAIDAVRLKATRSRAFMVEGLAN